LELLQKLHQPAAKVELGRMLFFDRILSGKKDITSATFHHPGLRSGDSLSLSIGLGEGGEWVPRKVLKIFNRGAEAGIPCFGTATCLAH